MGEYVPPLSVKAEDYFSPDFVDAEHAVYSPEDDEYYAPEGFYEYQYESDIAWHLSNPVKYWMPLLPLPTE